MAVQQSKVSKSVVRIRHAANAYKGVQATTCPNCEAPCAPHRACKKCGYYDGKQVISINNEAK